MYIDPEVLEILKKHKLINEMSIERSSLAKKCHSMSDIYALNIQKIVYFGDISASWRDFIYKSICFIPKRVLSDTRKIPDKDFVINNFLTHAFGEEYLLNPLEAIRKKLSHGVLDIQKTAKHELDNPREVIYSQAAENVKNFNDDILQLIVNPPFDSEDVEVLITQYLAIEQVPWY